MIFIEKDKNVGKRLQCSICSLPFRLVESEHVTRNYIEPGTKFKHLREYPPLTGPLTDKELE